ncbi:MAG TPA: hypothetical protein DGZ24_00045 [Rhodospirillaceae bacterium]|nr:hypothetical protein [Gammaproteobacteria bacterium]HCX13684.1 hypothetical protein [Rhodospirillaceae bacterium]
MILIISRFITLLGQTIAWLNPLMASLVVVVVTLRYLFDTGSLLLQESVIYLHGAVVMLGISYALQNKSHVRVDIVFSRWSKKTQATVDLVGHLIFLMPFSLCVLVFSWEYVLASWQIREGSQEVGGLQAVFALKTLIPAMAITLLIQGLAESLTCIRIIKGN